jgi:hypothetical protein
MASKMPPIPRDNRSPKGPGADPAVKADETGKGVQQTLREVPENPDQEGQQGNTKQNTTHQGYQQDR